MTEQRRPDTHDCPANMRWLVAELKREVDAMPWWKKKEAATQLRCAFYLETLLEQSRTKPCDDEGLA